MSRLHLGYMAADRTSSGALVFTGLAVEYPVNFPEPAPAPAALIPRQRTQPPTPVPAAHGGAR